MYFSHISSSILFLIFLSIPLFFFFFFFFFNDTATTEIYTLSLHDALPIYLTVVEMMKSYVREGDRVEVYMGTWCPDSVREVPKFLRIREDLKSQFGVELPATFVAVDRAKQQPAALIAGKDVQKIATFIYYRGDREVGRIVERPSGLFEDDLLGIVARD